MGNKSIRIVYQMAHENKDEKVEVKTKVCRTCEATLPLADYPSQTIGSTYMTHFPTYYRADCRKCFAALTYTKKGGFANKLTETERAALIANKKFYSTDTLAAFHRRCQLSLKIEAFRRYHKLGTVEKFLNSQI